MIAAGAEAVLPADHQEADSLVVDGIVQGLGLVDVERIVRDVAENDAVVGHQRERIAREGIGVQHFDGPFAVDDRLPQRLPVLFLADGIGHQQDLALPLDEDVADGRVVRRQLILGFLDPVLVSLLVDDDGRLVLVVTGRPEVQRQVIPILPGLELDGDRVADRLSVLRQLQLARAGLQRRNDDRGLVRLANLDGLRKLQAFHPDFGVVRIGDRDDVDRDPARPQLFEDRLQAAGRFAAVAEQYDPPASVFRQERRRQRQGLLDIRFVGRDPGVEVDLSPLEGERLPRRDFDGRVLYERHQPRGIFLRLLADRLGNKLGRLFAGFRAD